MSKKLVTTLVIVVIVLVLILAGMIFGMVWFRNNHIFVDGQPYPKGEEFLNLRGQELTVAQYDEISSQLPGCRIYWNVPFQGQYLPDDTAVLQIDAISSQDVQMLKYFPYLTTIDARGCTDYAALEDLQAQRPDLLVRYEVSVDSTAYPQDAVEVTLEHLTEADMAMLENLPALTTVNAQGCTDYENLQALMELRPDLAVSYSVNILGADYPHTTTELTFSDPDVAAILEPLAWLPELTSVKLGATSADADSLNALVETYPDIRFEWTKEALGTVYSSLDTEFDFSSRTDITLEQVEEIMRYFPNAEKVNLSYCGFENEVLAEFRERMRPYYKVVWTVIVTGEHVRTDETVFHSSGRKVCLIDEQSYDLFYCEDMIVVDIGHSYVKYIDWVKGMPNLQYLILADNWLKDISPISECKNLIYLELFINKHLKDLSPLVGCTSLKDLNISHTYCSMEPIMEMTWLENFYANCTNATRAEQQAVIDALPNTNCVFDGGYDTGGGWRELQSYFDMRDIMGMNYNAW